MVRYGLPIGLPGQARGSRTKDREPCGWLHVPWSTVQGADRIRCMPTITKRAPCAFPITLSVGGRRNLSRGLLGLFATTPRVLGGPRPPKSHPAPGKRPLVHGPVNLLPYKFVWGLGAQDRGPRGFFCNHLAQLQALLVQRPQIKVLSNVRRPRILVQGWPVMGARTLVLGLYGKTSSR